MTSFRIFFLTFHRRLFFQWFIVLLTVFPIIIVAFYGYYEAQKNITDVTLSKRETISYLAAVTLEEKLDHIIDIGKLEVSRPAVIDAIKSKKWNDAMLLIEPIRSDAPFIDRIILNSSESATMADFPHLPTITGSGNSKTDWYIGVSKEWKPYVSSVFLRKVYPQVYVVSVSIPIRDKTKVIGILGFQIQVDKFLKWSKSDSLPGEGYVYFVDQKGEVMGLTQYESAGKIMDYSSLKPAQKVLKGQKGVEIFYNPIEKKTKLIAYFPVKKYGWGVLVDEDVKSAFAQRDAELRSIISIFLFGVLMAVVLLFLVFRYSSLLGFSREKERILLESIGDGIFAINKEGIITVWNRAAETITGWKEEEVLGQSYHDVIKLISEEGHDRSTFIEEVITTGKIKAIASNTILVTKDGRKISVGDSAAPIFGAGKEIRGAIIIFRDITHEKELDEAKDEFVSLAAHQLRTPLGIIRWSIEALLKKDNLTKNVEESLRSILESDLNLIGSVNDILSVTHISSGKIVAKIQKLNILVELENAVTAIAPFAKEYGIVLKIDSKDRESMLMADQELFSQVLKNILSNAIKYSKKEGSVIITFQNKKSEVEIAIADTGIGIPISDIQKVFEKFSRGKNASKSNVEGTGLGLFVARHYLAEMNGKITLESIEDQGTTVYITLPKTV